MSHLKSIRRRLSFLAGSSMAAASLVSGSGFVLLAPAVSLAQTCSPDPAAAAATSADDSVSCSAALYAGGVTYTTNGDLTVMTTVDAAEWGAGGIRLIGVGDDNITFDTTLEIEGRSLVGALLDVSTVSGDIDISTEEVDADAHTATGVTHGIKAISGTGDVSIATTGIVGTNQGGPNSIGIEARSSGGDVAVNFGATVNGRLYGIVSSVTGDAGLTIDATAGSGGAVSANAATALATGIHATTGSGLLTITGATTGLDGAFIRSGAGGSSAFGTGVLIDAGGDVMFTGGGVGGQYGIRLLNVSAGTTSTLNIGRELSGGIAAIRAEGAGDVIVNITSRMDGALLNFDFTGMAQPVAVTFMTNERGIGSWRPGTSTVPDGNFTLTMEANTLLEPAPNAVITFAAPDAVFTSEGYVVIDQGAQLAGLSEFRQSGRIALGKVSTAGSLASSPGQIINGTYLLLNGEITDRQTNDILSLPGATWVGQGGEVAFDIDTSLSQTTCDRDGITGNLAAADCLRIVGGATEGVTYLNLRDRFAGDRGRLNEDGILLVDVAGGTSAQGHFVIGPNTPGYSSTFGGSIDKGIFQFVVAYDEAAQQHRLVGILSGNSYQFSRLGAASQSLWRTSTGTWLERQADLRGDIEGGIGGGVWLRAMGQQEDRDFADGEGPTFIYDNSFQQRSYAVTGGLDVMSGMQEDQAYVVGVMAGYAHSDIEYDDSPNEVRLNGGSLGLYASYIAGDFHVDALVNANRLTLRQDVPGFNFFPDGTLLSTRVMQYGAQVETGWRFMFAQGLFAEPMAGVSYVQSSFEDFNVIPDDPGRPGVIVSYDDPTSLRVSLGGRLGIDEDFGFLRTQVSILGRLWNELESENGVVIHNAAFPTDPDVLLTDDFSGRFTELGLGANVYSGGGAVSGFFNLGGRFGDDYEARTGSIGVRVNW